MTITSNSAIEFSLRSFSGAKLKILASPRLKSALHSCGGSSEFACQMFPLPSLFMTMFIFAALTRSGFKSKPKKFLPASSEI